jgi:hypothetical protein
MRKAQVPQQRVKLFLGSDVMSKSREDKIAELNKLKISTQALIERYNQPVKLSWEIRCELSRQDEALKQLSSASNISEMKVIEEEVAGLKQKLDAVREQLNQPESVELDGLIHQQMEQIKGLNLELFGNTFEGSPSFYQTM